MPQPRFSPDLATADFFFVTKLKTPMKGKPFGTIEDKRKIETGAVGDTKKNFRRVSRIGKNVYYIWGGYFEGDKIVIDK